MLLKLPPETPRNDDGFSAPVVQMVGFWLPGGTSEIVQDVTAGVGVDVGVACAIAEPDPQARPAIKPIAPSKMRDFIFSPKVKIVSAELKSAPTGKVLL